MKIISDFSENGYAVRTLAQDFQLTILNIAEIQVDLDASDKKLRQPLSQANRTIELARNQRLLARKSLTWDRYLYDTRTYITASSKFNSALAAAKAEFGPTTVALLNRAEAGQILLDNSIALDTTEVTFNAAVSGNALTAAINAMHDELATSESSQPSVLGRADAASSVVSPPGQVGECKVTVLTKGLWPVVQAEVPLSATRKRLVVFWIDGTICAEGRILYR